MGPFSMFGNLDGYGNTAIGPRALQNNTNCSKNIALGLNAGSKLTTGGNNIPIGHAGVAAESNIIRLGTSQTDTYFTGIIHGNGSALTGIASTSLASNLTLGGTTAGTFSGPLTGNVTGNVSGSAASFTGTLAGNVTGPQGATVVSTVGGVTAANVASGANLANAATDGGTPGTIVKRDGAGNFNANTIFLGGSLSLPSTGGIGAGVLMQGGTRMLHSYGTNNFFAGANAGNFLTSGTGASTAVGGSSLSSNTTRAYAWKTY